MAASQTGMVLPRWVKIRPTSAAYATLWICEEPGSHDTDNTYVAYQTHTSPLQINWGYGIYLDTDNNRNTGFRGFSDEFPIGVDVIVEGFTLHKYTGTGLNWNWTEGEILNYAQAGDVAEIAIPQSDLGNLAELSFFLLADNMAVSGNVLDYYPDTATDTRASQRYFSYRYFAAAPQALSQSLQVVNDSVLNITLSGSVSNNATPVYAVTEQPQNGTLSGTWLFFRAFHRK